MNKIKKSKGVIFFYLILLLSAFFLCSNTDKYKEKEHEYNLVLQK